MDKIPYRKSLTAQSGRTDFALMGALCFFLSAIDYLIPKPLPFMRIGLANLPLLIALQFFPARDFFLLAFVKVIGQALITGTLFSYTALFSLAGTALSAVTMKLLYRKASLAGTSIAGAFVSNAAQLFLARYVLFGEGILYLAPPFLAAGIISGGLLGFFAMNFSAKSQWFKQKRENLCTQTEFNDDEKNNEEKTVQGEKAGLPYSNNGGKRKSGSRLWNFILLFLAAVFLFVPLLPFRAALFLIFWILAIMVKRKTRPLFTILSLVMITACNCFPPFGKILFRAGPVIIAEGSLLLGIQRAVTMGGLIMFSRLALLSIPQLPGKFGALMQDCFGILELMNSIFFDSNKKTQGIKTKKTTGGLITKLDRLLCQVSRIYN